MGHFILQSCNNNTTNMKLLVCMLLVGVVSCTSLLKNPPPNADIRYIYKNNKLVEVKFDYSDDLRPVVKSAIMPAPIAAAPKPVLKTAGASKKYYKVDDGELERVNPTHVRYSVLPNSPAAPVVKSAPVPAVPAPAPVAAPEPLIIAGPTVVLRQAPAPTARSVIIRGPQVIYKRGPAPVAAPAPAPVVLVKSVPTVPAKSPLIKTFYKKDDGELEKINPTHVSYSFVKSAPAPAPAPLPIVAPALVVYSVPVPLVKAAPLPDVDESVEEEDED